MLSTERGRAPLATAALALLLCVTSAHSADKELAAIQNQLAFYSPFWPNLHHVLYAEAWRARGPGRPSRAGTLPEPLTGELTPDERRQWDEAVAYYERELADHDLLFELGDIRRALYSGGGKLPDTGLGKAHHDALAAAAPIYAKYWWPAHDRANRAWIAETLPRLAQVAPAVTDKLARLYGAPWFQTPAHVDVVRVGDRRGNYTDDTPAPGYITLSSSDPNNQGWAAVDVVFHESSHAVFEQALRDPIAREEREQRKNTGPLWHVAMFYVGGEAVREALAAHKIESTQYCTAPGSSIGLGRSSSRRSSTTCPRSSRARPRSRTRSTRSSRKHPLPRRQHARQESRIGRTNTRTARSRRSCARARARGSRRALGSPR